MKKEWILSLALVLAVAASFAVLFSCSKKAVQCPLCERDVHAGMQVNITHHKIPMRTCCMACALIYKAQTTDVEIKSVTDFLSGESLDPKHAFYVVDSEISPCIQDPKVQKYIRDQHSALHACYDRCAPGILAFGSRNIAEKFIRQHGGVIGQFENMRNFISVKGGSHHD